MKNGYQSTFMLSMHKLILDLHKTKQLGVCAVLWQAKSSYNFLYFREQLAKQMTSKYDIRAVEDLIDLVALKGSHCNDNTGEGYIITDADKIYDDEAQRTKDYDSLDNFDYEMHLEYLSES